MLLFNVVIENVYPVPVNDQLCLSLSGQGKYHVQLIDISGRVVHEFRIQDNIKSLVIIDVARCRAGVYYIRVSDGTTYDSRKIIIVH